MCTIHASVAQRGFPAVKEAFTSAQIPFSENDDGAILVWLDSLKEGDKVFQRLKPFQIINRIPNVNVLCRKAPLARIIQRIAPFFPNLFTFMPKSYILPFKNTQLVRALSRDNCCYIIKPDSGSLGQGITIVEPNTEFEPDDTMAVAQQYIDSFLIDNTKFDLRIYALVTSVNPLTIYVYRGGLARFCSEENDGDTIYSKLTNVAINHNSVLLTEVFKKMKNELNIDTDDLWKKIDAAIALTIISAASFIQKGVEWHCPSMSGYNRCFQILGFDILLDKKCQPYVLEVNYRPSLDTHNGDERRMKVDLIRSAILIGAPFHLAQHALSERKWAWTKDSWEDFLRKTPEIASAADASRKNAVKKSKYEMIWPSTDPEKKEWQKVYEKAIELPLEQMPGITVPQSITGP
ncbi:Tubulin-tyrosine ligase family protein [Tritrichomonas foetus]|uniref:Tubulin-tyrosine ligase family protein n=1 Tax=Tritrichomonas foetus TaxID=1144522 RepID=A0A1J4K9Z6_9EUKA|nr:Tubulin-tyrosine ligase family protein [Tritrichomonas foetus]|eukprot:OHT06269.1 Tubulin-tyrosine ligase family protein [Tritrichomonas foetus]